MKVLSRAFLLSLVLVCFAAAPSFAQKKVVGTIIEKEEADQLFGSVLEHQEFSKAEMQKLLDGTSNVILFEFFDGKLVVLGDKRSELLNPGISVTAETKFHLFSKSQLVRLIEEGKEEFTSVEKRKNVLSITNGLKTMEFSDICPPLCAGDESENVVKK